MVCRNMMMALVFDSVWVVLSWWVVSSWRVERWVVAVVLDSAWEGKKWVDMWGIPVLCRGGDWEISSYLVSAVAIGQVIAMDGG